MNELNTIEVCDEVAIEVAISVGTYNQNKKPRSFSSKGTIFLEKNLTITLVYVYYHTARGNATPRYSNNSVPLRARH